jgi:hypothetical protein
MGIISDNAFVATLGKVDEIYHLEYFAKESDGMAFTSKTVAVNPEDLPEIDNRDLLIGELFLYCPTDRIPIIPIGSPLSVLTLLLIEREAKIE